MIGSKLAHTTAFIATVIVLTASGCSTDSDARGPAPDQQAADARGFVELVTSTINYEYEQRKDPASLRDEADISVLGEVASVADGRLQGPLDEAPAHFITIGLDVVETFKEDPQRMGGLVYFEIRRPDNINAEQYRQMLPDNTRILLIADRAVPIYEPVTNDEAGREKGSTLYAPYPQGLNVETPRGMSSVLSSPDEGTGWPGIESLEELAIALRR